MQDTIETRGRIGAIAVVNERTLVFGYRDRKGIDLLDIMDADESALQTLGRYLNLRILLLLLHHHHRYNY